jgi:phosphatidylserine/phosphatidylglycerophosphate/cardiolipin synthase-like enzyme
MAQAATLNDARATLLRPGETCWRVAHARRVAFLVDGEAFFSALAGALERARRRIVLLGWDFHGRVRLRRDGRSRGPDDFLGLLTALLRRRPGLEVYALGWSYGALRAAARELLPGLHLGLRTPPRLSFRVDAVHPWLGCHHQKVIAIDGAQAFAGGFDVTAGRWDSRDHEEGDPRRTAPDGRPYQPFHDVQMAVDGEAAAALAELAEDRWRRATGAALPALAGTDEGDGWPPELAPSLRSVDVGIARTEPAHGGRTPVREVEALYLASIAAARRWIYAENQYLTSEAIVGAFARRLQEPDGPEIVVVGPRRCPAWLEEVSMGVLRGRAVHQLRAADRHGRLRLYHPAIPSGACLNVHSKVMVVDDVFARVGSSNLANRSLALDTECDLAVEAGGRPDLARGIGALRDDLLAEHLGSTERTVREAIRARGSLIAAIEALRGGPRTLEPLPEPAPRWAIELISRSGLADPGPTAWAERLATRPRRRPPRARRLRIALVVLAVCLAAGLVLGAATR